MTLNDRMDRITEKAEGLQHTFVDWTVNKSGEIEFLTIVRTKPTGDVENKLTDLLRKVADEMEVSRQ